MSSTYLFFRIRKQLMLKCEKNNEAALILDDFV